MVKHEYLLLKTTRLLLSVYFTSTTTTSNDLSVCAEALSDVLRVGMECYSPFSDVPLSSKIRL